MHTSSSAISARFLRSITTTCRILSSRSRKASSTCFRQETERERSSHGSEARSRWSRKASSTRRQLFHVFRHLSSTSSSLLFLIRTTSATSISRKQHMVSMHLQEEPAVRFISQQQRLKQLQLWVRTFFLSAWRHLLRISEEWQYLRVS